MPKKTKTPVKPSSTSPFLTRQELAERWRCSLRTIDGIPDSAVPRHRITESKGPNARVLFRLDDVEAWEAKCRKH